MSFLDDFDDFGQGGGSFKRTGRGPGRRASFAGPCCPACSKDRSNVIETRPAPAGTRRRRKCLECEHRWTTYEVNYNPDELSVVSKEDKVRIIRLAEIADAVRKSLKL